MCAGDDEQIRHLEIKVNGMHGGWREPNPDDQGWYHLGRMEDGVVDRIERAFVAAIGAHLEPIRLELTKAQHDATSSASH
ncbi:MAG: hypothetical protein JOZ87_39530 [Chloroflexi bacterium]|nr:hypothetical protein [Chloroflexota bacterium]